jgi:hypothetical protein
VQAIRLWLRYVAPLTALSALALSPVLLVALRTPPPADAAQARAMIALGWKLLALAWFGQLVLVGGAAAIARDTPSQLAALGRGAAQMLRAIVPCLAAAAGS